MLKDVSEFDRMIFKQLLLRCMLKKVGFQLTILAKAVIEIDVYVDPDFENDNLS